MEVRFSKCFFGTPLLHSIPVGCSKRCYDKNLLLPIIYGIQCDFRQKSFVFLPHKTVVFRWIFFTKSIFLAKRSTFTYSMSYIFGSFCISSQFRLSGNHFSASYEASDLCWQIAGNSPQHLRPCLIAFQPYINICRHIGQCVSSPRSAPCVSSVRIGE